MASTHGTPNTVNPPVTLACVAKLGLAPTVVLGQTLVPAPGLGAVAPGKRHCD